MKIMIADDDVNLSRAAEMILRANGHVVIKVVDASQILPAAQREKPTLILLDVIMPGGNGRDILIKLKRSSLTSNIQVIVVSGMTDLKMRTTIMQDGAEGYLPKPWAQETFMHELQKIAPHLPW